MKVGVYLGNFKPNQGGAYTFENSLLESLSRYECKHQFYVFYNGQQPLNCGKLKFISLEEERKRVQYFSFNRLLHKLQIEILWFLSAASVEVDIPFIYTVWDLQHRVQPFFPEVSVSGWTWDERENHYKSVLRKATFIITPNEVGKQEVMAFYQIPSERVVCLPHPTPNFALTENYDLPKKSSILPQEKYLFYPAQFWPHKNHVIILLALKILQEKYGISLSVVFTGFDMGNQNYIEELVSNFNLQKQVKFFGFVTHDELITLYQNAFALVYPTFFGPENLPPLEAFALGCPVIASKVSGAVEQFGDAALLFDPKNESDLVSKIRELYTDSKLRNALTKKGKERALKWTCNDYINAVGKIINDFEPIRRCWSNKTIFQHYIELPEIEFNNKFLGFIQNCQNKSVVIFGAGINSIIVVKYLEECNIKNEANFNILCYVDNSSKKQGDIFYKGLLIENPNCTKVKEADLIIITAIFGKESIFNQLTTMGISKNKIIFAF